MPSFEHTKQVRGNVEDEVYKPGSNKPNNLETTTATVTESETSDQSLSRPAVTWGDIAKDNSKESSEIEENAPSTVEEAGNEVNGKEPEPAIERPKPTPINDRDLPDPGPALLQRSAVQLASQEEENRLKKRSVRGRSRVIPPSAKAQEPSFGEVTSPAEVKESLSGRMAHGPVKKEIRTPDQAASTPKVETPAKSGEESQPAATPEFRNGKEREFGEDRPQRQRREKNRHRDGKAEEQRKEHRPEHPKSNKPSPRPSDNAFPAPRHERRAEKQPEGLLARIIAKIKALFGGEPAVEKRSAPAQSRPTGGERSQNKDFNHSRKPGDGRPPRRRRRRSKNKNKGNSAPSQDRSA